MSDNITKDLVFLVLQYFDEEDLKEASHALERESGLYFDLKYFEDMVLEGMWDDAENYLSVFTKVKDNNHSIKIYFEMRKQKYFEALDNNERYKALDILLKDLKVFARGNEELFKELTLLLTVDDIREIKSTYENANSARKELMVEIKKIILQHPLLDGKLNFPVIRSHRLRNLLNERFHSIS
ncbi:protein TPR3-like [Abrus precatorius]|uniref:Protein TPR3-like n=1 Tax=Abrus precatorius TaxID=3816 RepID=A0A8B8JRY0_ABRPR|nr:protein TPR3-like [Abrus precatorius]